MKIWTFKVERYKNQAHREELHLKENSTYKNTG